MHRPKHRRRIMGGGFTGNRHCFAVLLMKWRLVPSRDYGVNEKQQVRNVQAVLLRGFLFVSKQIHCIKAWSRMTLQMMLNAWQKLRLKERILTEQLGCRAIRSSHVFNIKKNTFSLRLLMNHWILTVRTYATVTAQTELFVP